jgi:hypothetical protein
MWCISNWPSVDCGTGVHWQYMGDDEQNNKEAVEDA